MTKRAGGESALADRTRDPANPWVGDLAAAASGAVVNGALARGAERPRATGGSPGQSGAIVARWALLNSAR